MTGESNLSSLLKGMEPVLQKEILVFATVPEEREALLPQRLSVVGQFREAEGLTLILPQSEARDAGLACSGPMRQITLTIHSSLEAIGLTAAFSAALTREGISANVVAGFYHDHIFVPEKDAERAMAALLALAAQGGQAAPPTRAPST
ncbi:ACT domain-containing protein [Gellertiella hungarica]|uniref:DUF2241 domain-containing protein n=1 Tax=Gellertiella hungarica TaxID=1572859 RepID=A0A7W6J298_9HYPH|nr:ACT domain-containing protein [Gellertiella hungarica]MBB4063463.1 hypothetical protein [Gellertiella hungarica]